MREGSLLITVSGELRADLERRAKEDRRTPREEAAYLVEWALMELAARERDAATAAA